MSSLERRLRPFSTVNEVREENSKLRERIAELEEAAGAVARIVEYELRGNPRRDSPPWKGPLDRLQVVLAKEGDKIRSRAYSGA